MEFAYIGAIGVIASIFFGYCQYQRGKKAVEIANEERYKAEGTTDGTLKADLDYIKRRSDDLLLEQREMNKNIHVLSERLTRVEESAKSAHKRIDSVVEECRGHRKELL